MRPTARRLCLVGLTITLGLCRGAALAGGLVGSSFHGVLYDINPATGVATNPRSTGLDALAGIAARPDGSLYGLTAMGGAPVGQALYSIDAATGGSTLIGPVGLPDIFEGDIALDPVSGRLYGIQQVSASVARGLFSIDPTTGAGTLVGDIDVPTVGSDLSAMAFDSSGRLYIVDRTGTLLRVDPLTAHVISSVALSSQLGNTAGMAIDPGTGVAYVVDGDAGGTNSLYRLNLTTGVLTLIGNTGVAGGMAGLTFVGESVPIPEPTSLVMALTAAGAGSLLPLLRRRACLGGT